MKTALLNGSVTGGPTLGYRFIPEFLVHILALELLVMGASRSEPISGDPRGG